MITFKQLEAFYWIAELGGFEAAAQRLHTTQSAVSKRMVELEVSMQVELFDRSRRSARLTEKGRSLLAFCQDILTRRDRLLEEIASKDAVPRRLRLGVTELTALTWLPRLVERLRLAYPSLVIEPEVEASATLYQRLADDTLDLIISPDMLSDATLCKTHLVDLKNAWMYAPASFAGEPPTTTADLFAQTLLVQGVNSGTGYLYSQWLLSNDIAPKRMIVSNSLPVQLGLVIAGIGISYLPIDAMAYLTERSVLRVLDVEPALPDVAYVASYRLDRASELISTAVDISVECCSFELLLMAGPFDASPAPT